MALALHSQWGYCLTVGHVLQLSELQIPHQNENLNHSRLAKALKILFSCFLINQLINCVQ